MFFLSWGILIPGVTAISRSSHIIQSGTDLFPRFEPVDLLLPLLTAPGAAQNKRRAYGKFSPYALHATLPFPARWRSPPRFAGGSLPDTPLGPEIFPSGARLCCRPGPRRFAPSHHSRKALPRGRAKRPEEPGPKRAFTLGLPPLSPPERPRIVSRVTLFWLGFARVRLRCFGC